MIWNEMEYNKNVEDKFETEPEIEYTSVRILANKNFIEKLTKETNKC